MSSSHAVSSVKHLAIIMDGNGRWAKARHQPRAMGHRAGVDSLRKTIESCVRHGIEALTVFAFSTENWRRPDEEVGLLMDLFMRALEREVDELAAQRVALRFIGDRSAFSSELQSAMLNAERQTATHQPRLHLNIAANYGGQQDIVQAVQQVCQRVQQGRLDCRDIDAQQLHMFTALADLPAPDLLIRTGGEQRISNFLLWQAAYTELYFTDVYWPDFNEVVLTAALEDYALRQRRFGRTGEQVQPPESNKSV
ncbi:MAG: polyprenyl diphosphate synthase [Ilumatobacteraceae bacterium]